MERDAIDTAIAAHDFDAALDLLEAEAERRSLTAAELIEMGRWILLSEGREHRRPKDALAVFERVLSDDPSNAAALAEIGWYWYAVENDARRARPFFEKACESAAEDLRDAVEGLANCIHELEEPGAVERWLDGLCRSTIDAEAILRKLVPIVREDGEDSEPVP